MAEQAKPNTRKFLIALDTETQLLYDDTPLMDYVESINKKIRQTVEQYKKGTIEKDEMTKSIHDYTTTMDAGTKLFGKDGVTECNKILTYALGWLELCAPSQMTKRDFSHHKKALERHKKHDGDFWTCPVCSEESYKDVKVVLDLDNENNVWRQFFSKIESCPRYKKAQVGDTHKLKIYVHNLKFDACSLLEFITKEQQKGNCNIKSLVIKDNAYYSISFALNGYVYEFCDSLKIIVQPLAKAGALVNIRKTTEDATYNWFDLRDTSILDPEIDYLKHDVIILQRLIWFIKKNLSINKLTAASFAFANLRAQVYQDDHNYKRHYWDIIFKPSYTQDEEAYCRKAYYGGVTITMPNRDNILYKGIGFSFDVNSEYPAAMLQDYPNTETRTVGSASMMHRIFKRGGLSADCAFYRIQIHTMTLKKGAVPCFPKKSSRFAYGGSILSKDDLKSDIVTLIGYDLRHVIMNYKIKFDYLDGIYFTKKLRKPFHKFVKNHTKLKEEATRAHNKALKLVAKLNLNSCYGKLAERFSADETLATWDDKEQSFKITTEQNDREWKPKGNIILGALITAKARDILLTETEKLNTDKRFLVTYTDTDSIHGMYYGKHKEALEKIAQKIRAGEKVKEDVLNDYFIKVCEELNVKYDSARLGYFKAEGFFDKAIWLGPKRYFEADLVEGDNYKIAGVQKQGKEYIAGLGVEEFCYRQDKELIVPFQKTIRVHGGYKFINTYKILSTNALYTL